MNDEFLWAPMRSPLRWVLAALAAISAATHLPVLGEHLRDVPYIGVEFVVLIVACVLIAAAAPCWDSAALYVAAAITCGLAVAAYVATRAVTLPGLADDVGNWFEPLGVVAVFAETAAVAIAICALGQYHSGVRS